MTVNRIRCALVVLLHALTLISTAREGMWIPSLLEAIEDEMKAYGLKLTAEDLYSANHSSLKDAIALFGGGCTAELVSSKGLLFTNHHCGYSYIQQHSSLANDYLTHGYWAMSAAEELPCPGLTATFIVRMDEVTAQVMDGAKEGMNAEALAALKADNIKRIESEWKKNTGYQAVVRAFNYGNQFLVIVSRTFNDVRLVGAPPSAIGKFGGDTDNWVWPRHTGDFSVFRVYANAQNEPAAYNADNKPFEPARHFEISLDGVEEGDFTMVYGFPGRTDHLVTSYTVDYLVNTSNPLRIAMRTASLDMLRSEMNNSDRVRIQYAAKQSNIANAWKKWIGQNEGLLQADALRVKRDYEMKLMEAAAAVNSQDMAILLSELRTLYDKRSSDLLARDAVVEYYYYGPELFRFAAGLKSMVTDAEKLKNENKLSGKIAEVRHTAESFYKDFDLGVEKKLFKLLTPYFTGATAKCTVAAGSFGQFAAGVLKPLQNPALLYDKSLLRDEATFIKWLDSFSPKAAARMAKDPVYRLAMQLADADAQTRAAAMDFNRTLDGLMQPFVKEAARLLPESKSWADANSTLRLSFGRVEGSRPRDGMCYTYYTTADGILNKYKAGDPDFDLPERLIKLLKGRRFGLYGHNGELRVCYTGSNHTTGGNSGSPALNAYGQLVGINFDRTWESTMSDVLYNETICRNIMVDIRYVLWVIDVYADCHRLIDELSLVKSSGEEPERR